ncbi:potassium/proton antiporter [Desulfomicrobium orale]|uniref:K+/H+ antiporter n=1 Tax=Desulfomicrobium orale DSM 12838 TaxID=888061 RepID=A0A109W6J3_9BACT|nr:potassium/proton antiporter [Desulfomicrobium orale]AMD93710.1 K+/H+ antiporter [Desulfomicrobium orale DSM 12838]
MSGYILAAAAIILVCLLLSKLSGRMGVPTLALFILLGMLVGSDGLLKIHFDDFIVSGNICTIALIFIIFYGGFGTNWNHARHVAVKATLLSSLGVVLTAVLTGGFCHYVLGIGMLESILVGAIISSTDAASVFSILRSKKLSLKYGTSSLLEVESGSNDPFSYMMTVIVLSAMKGNFDGANLLLMIVQQVFLGVAFGAAAGLLSAKMLSRFRMSAEGFDTIFVFGVTLITYAGADYTGGNGYLSVYILGIILGNQPIQNKKNLVHFFDGVTGLMQILVFFLLGLLSFPSQLPQIFFPALCIALFLTFIARPLAIFLLLSPFRCPVKQQLLVSWAGLRGAASIVFAIMATVDSAHMHNDIFHITFLIVLFSIFTQGSLIPFMANKLDMIDLNSNVMKTFNDYSDEIQLQFIQISIFKDHPWADMQIKDMNIIPDLLIVMILRDGERIIPNGNTRIMPGDMVIITAMSANTDSTFLLTEMKIDGDSEWIDQSLEEINLGKECLIIAIKRKDAIVIPRGKTSIRKDDVLITCKALL